MKKIISILVLIGILSTMFIIPIAAEGGTCVQHGPWSSSCTNSVSEVRNSTHSFTYQGYQKICSYQYNIYTTRRTCTYPDCGYVAYSTHSHGYSGHASECGWSNDSSCRLYIN